MPRKTAPTNRSRNKNRGYDPDTVKAEPMNPLEAVATFLALLQMGANIDRAAGRDTYEMWRIARGYTT